MIWTQEAIILSQKKFSESSAIISLFTPTNGVHKGMVRGAFSKNNRAIYQTGNIVQATWKARLSEHLGNFNCELIDVNYAKIMHDFLRLSALSSICTLIEDTLPEREENEIIFNLLKNLIIMLVNNHKNWKNYYVYLELKLLEEIGYGLDLQNCAATGANDNLSYISPKSGRAVSKIAGEEYKDRLFKMPQIFTNKEETTNDEDIYEALKITQYFLDKYYFTPNNLKLSVKRSHFIEILSS